jgi:C_GCAxxG_C_C family probable redox protein
MKTINNLSKKESIELAFKIGFEGEVTRTNCAQESFHAISSVLGVKNPLIFRSLSALEAGGGITTKGSCGAFSGALAAFSFFFGRTYEQWEKGESYIKASILGQKLYKKFDEEFQTVICTEIHKKIYGRAFELMDHKNLGIDKDVLKEFEDAGAHTLKCPTVVGLSSAWAVEILWDALPGDADLSEVISMEEALKKYK